MSEVEIEEVSSEGKKKGGCLSGCIGNILKLIGALVVLSVCSIVLLTVFADDIEEQFEAVMTSVPAEQAESQTVTTNEGRTFTVPGDAYTDGRDTQATEPVTINRINIWSSIERTGTNCTLEHAVPIRLTRVEYKDSESRYYFRLSSGGCSGWLPGDFLSTRAEAVIGDLFP